MAKYVSHAAPVGGSSELQGIARFKIHDDKVDEFRRLSAQCMEIVRTKDTGTLQYETYFNDDQSECIVLERYRDSKALIEHLAHVGDLMAALVATGSVSGELLGEASAELRAQLADSGVGLFTPYQSMSPPTATRADRGSSTTGSDDPTPAKDDRLLPVEEVVVRLDVLGEVPQVEDLAVAEAKDMHLIQRDRRAIGAARRLMDDHGGVLVVGVDGLDVEGLGPRRELEVLDQRRGDGLSPLVVTAVGAIATEVEHAVVGQVGQRSLEIALRE